MIDGIGSSYRDQWTNAMRNGGVEGSEESQSTGQVWNAVFTDKKENGVSVDDFLNLMVAQLQNQDFMNPVDDTQYVTQLAQFATMQQMQEMASYMKTNYVMSLVGKNVTAAKFSISGELQKETGTVEKISLVNNEYMVYVNGKKFSLEQIMEIHSSSAGSGSGKPDPGQLEYLMSLVGKEVTIRRKGEDGEEEKVTGTVIRVSTEDGKYQVFVDDGWYPLEDVLEVGGSSGGSKDQEAYLSTLVGREVTVRQRDEFGDGDGKLTGVVEKVSSENGNYRVCIGGQWYPLDDVLEVGGYQEDKSPDGEKPDKIPGISIEGSVGTETPGGSIEGNTGTETPGGSTEGNADAQSPDPAPDETVEGGSGTTVPEAAEPVV